MSPGPPRLAVVVVSHNSADCLGPCLSSVVAHRGDVDLDLIVVDSGSTDETAAVVAGFPDARLIRSENRGFAHANNRGLEQTEAPWALLLNPDTEVVSGTFEDLLSATATRHDVAVLGVRHVGPQGELQYSIRRRPTPWRMLLDALGVEGWPAGQGLGERVLDAGAYEREGVCDWVSGAAMLVRVDVVMEIGGLDERFFLYCEEPDLSLRLARRGLRTAYAPAMTILHHGGTESSSERLAAQFALSQRLYLEKHFRLVGRAFGIASLSVGFGLRALVGGRDRGGAKARRAAARAALRSLHRLSPPPFG